MKPASRSNIRIAVQKSGRLRDGTFRLLAELGLVCDSRDDKVLIAPCRGSDVEILFVRHGDIPHYVQGGAADFGFVGHNILAEADFDVQIVKQLDYGQCRLVLAVPVDSPIHELADLDGERIATTYPGSLRAFLRAQRLNASIVEIQGAVEASPALGLADAICDLVQTGRTLRANGLHPIATVATSTAVLIESPYASAQKTRFKEKYLQPLMAAPSPGKVQS